MSLAATSVSEHGFDAWLAHKRSRRIKNWLIVAAGAAVLAWCVRDTILFDTDWARMGGALGIGGTLERFFWVDWSLAPKLLVPALETLMMATLGTILGCILSLPVAWFGAANVTPSRFILYPLGRFLMVLSRSIHEIIWALLFVGAVGLGALPGILAVAMRSIGFISKITAEAIENIDPKPVEAIRAVGGNQFQVMYYGIVPQILPVIIGTIIFEWDINIRRSAIMGLVGAGGLGLVFFRQMAMFNYGGVTLVVLAVLALIALGEVVSHFARKAVI
ncbi:phosphonate ABC transporter, permease protein PhnE [Shinella sp. HZN7]|jgi:phosphonate transport system permease protein|uniref:phosphonate ABC transporter, permease protein PhnE n=1 Tax=Shinella sp. (strain HZN7) TaxID=879274 RepID=UPI0007DAA088|nr:phosphonate ABC transporter, permease protein PhnE [Shinella sp. HZN7]ANH05620.1 phosphonate ABC transporter, permease protein PhnE [Shinella sp. HZN7]